MPTENEPFYYLPLFLRADGIFCPLDGVGLHGSDMPLVSELEGFVSREYEDVRGTVELSGRVFTGQVLAPKNGRDHHYIVVNSYGIPEFATTSDTSPSKSQVDTFASAFEKLEHSEALSPQESVFISDSFVEPEFEEIDESGKAIRRISWASLREMARVVIVGAPGAGKTTTLRRLGLEQLKQGKGKAVDRYPVYVQMRHLNEGAGVEQLVHANLLEQEATTAANLPCEPKISDLRVVLILDGLDEVPERLRQRTTDAISSFASKYETLSITCSTREAGYHWAIPSFRYVRIRPFSIERIREWSYYRLRHESTASWLDFMTSLEERQEVASIVSNPLLLSLAVSLYRRTSCLPQNRSTLMRGYFDAMTEQWDSVRGVIRHRDLWASPTRKLAALCRVAYGLRASGSEFFTESEFQSWNSGLGADASLLRVCERDTGIVKWNRDNERWFISHRMFADYLTARYIVEQTDDISTSMRMIFERGDWADTWAYACGITQDATSLVTTVLSNRHVSRITKLTAIGLAFEQDVIVSSDVARNCLSFLKAEVRRSLLKPTAGRLAGKCERAIVFKSETARATDIAAALQSLQRLRFSALGYAVIDWLKYAKEPHLKQLAKLLSCRDIVTVSVRQDKNCSAVTLTIPEKRSDL